MLNKRNEDFGKRISHDRKIDKYFLCKKRKFIERKKGAKFLSKLRRTLIVLTVKHQQITINYIR